MVTAPNRRGTEDRSGSSAGDRWEDTGKLCCRVRGEGDVLSRGDRSLHVQHSSDHPNAGWAAEGPAPHMDAALPEGPGAFLSPHPVWSGPEAHVLKARSQQGAPGGRWRPSPVGEVRPLGRALEGLWPPTAPHLPHGWAASLPRAPATMLHLSSSPRETGQATEDPALKQRKGRPLSVP